MTHHHLALELLDSLKRNTDKNDYRGTAERDVHAACLVKSVHQNECCYLGEQNREDSDNAQKQCSEERDSRNNFCDVFGGRSAGTDTGDHTAVLRDVLRHLYGVVLNA